MVHNIIDKYHNDICEECEDAFNFEMSRRMFINLGGQTLLVIGCPKHLREAYKWAHKMTVVTELIKQEEGEDKK